MTSSVSTPSDRLGRSKRLDGPRFWALLAGASLGLGMGAGVVANAAGVHAAPLASPADAKTVLAALKLRLPKTAISEVTCQGLGGLCEVVAGTTLFYVDHGARYLMIGRVYDMETRSDLTAARLLALNPDLLVAGAARKAEAEEADAPAAPPSPTRVNLAELPASGAIHWGPATAPKLVVLSDFACSYCRALVTELKAIGARVEERPISIFGPPSRAVAEGVLCAKNPVAALHAAYQDRKIPSPRKCDTSGLDANEAFARRHGFGGTPVIIRADGAVIEGFRPAAVLKEFLKGGDA